MYNSVAIYAFNWYAISHGQCCMVATELGAIPFQPNNINWMAVCLDLQSDLAFNWSSVTPDCPAIHYNILSSNCGSCPTTTTHTTVTCTDVPTDGSMCTFALETVVCGNVTGNLSDNVQGILKGIRYYTLCYK